MSTQIKIKCGYIILIFVLIYGCANPYQVRQLPFTEPTPPNPDETLIYVFRENSFFAGARKFGIIANDTVVCVLSPEEFCNFTVKSGENEIVAYMSPSPLMHYRVQSRPGKKTYLLCKVGYTAGMFIEEIDEDKAGELIKQFKYTEIEVKNQKAKANYKTYYDNLYK